MAFFGLWALPVSSYYSSMKDKKKLPHYKFFRSQDSNSKLYLRGTIAKPSFSTNLCWFAFMALELYFSINMLKEPWIIALHLIIIVVILILLCIQCTPLSSVNDCKKKRAALSMIIILVSFLKFENFTNVLFSTSSNLV